MFGKLVKYELKSIGKWYFILYLLTLLVSIVLGMMVTTVDSQNNYEIGQSTLSALLVLIFVALLVGLSIGTIFLVISRFYKNIFGREGYLTMTLPVTEHQILLSKLLSSFIWVIMNGFVLGLSFFLVALPSLVKNSAQILAAFPEISTIFRHWELYMGIVYLFLSILASILVIYLSIVVGQTFHDRRILASFVSYFLINILMGIVWNFISDLFISWNQFDISYLIFGSIYQLVISTIFYFIMVYLMKEHLNLQ